MNGLLRLTCLVVVVAVIGGAAATAGELPPAEREALGYATGGVCKACHAEAYAAWRGSDHDLAMQEATAETVLGDFDDAATTHYGVTSRFFKRDGRFFVETEAADGKLAEYEIAYTFGVDPLQQYLIAFPGGRYQALNLAWDTRPSEQGGQRWFHLYPDEHIAADDELHWTGINQNWNYMCADCHSTRLRRGYDLEQDVYRTTWTEIDVACEACHGPGKDHVAWAEARGGTGPGNGDAGNGLKIRFDETRDTEWRFPAGAVTAVRTPAAPAMRTEVEACGRCHARRAALGDDYVHGSRVMDHYRVSLLTEDLYHADGQIDDEVYVYGSFLQSRMYRAGVTCSDCHDPHSLKLRAEGNAVCTRCHKNEAFDAASHHFHQPGSEGSACVACHAPEKTYMVVDPRRDHSFRVPRPDLSVSLGTPNVCTGCHDDKTDRWAAETVAGWRGGKPSYPPHYGEALAAGRAGAPGAQGALIGVVQDLEQPAIARATALTLLGRNPGPQSIPALLGGLSDADALVRLAAVEALGAASPEDRYRLVFSLLQDPVRAVRLEAARMLAPVPPDALADEQRARLEQGFAELEAALVANAGRPEALLTLGNFQGDRGDDVRAEETYRTAVRRHPTFAPAYANLADLYRARGEEEKAVDTLRAGLEKNPDDADLLHALGLSLIRKKDYAEAVKPLGRAAENRPDVARYAYVQALALQRTGEPKRALEVLADARQRHPFDREILYALATISLETGDTAAAFRFAEQLARLAPDDPQAQQLLQSLQPKPR